MDAAQPVCRFGTTAAAATVASDALVRCVAPWGVGGRRSRVSLALNGVDAAADGLWLTFEGRSRAHVVAATLADDATAVSLRFGTPTDRGGATPGLSDCAPLLTNASLALVGGAAAQCAWPSARELRVHLGAAAPLRAGDAISVRAAVIAPRGWAGSCAGEGELCPPAARPSARRRARAPLVAHISAPDAVADCDIVTLDGSHSWVAAPSASATRGASRRSPALAAAATAAAAAARHRRGAAAARAAADLAAAALAATAGTAAAVAAAEAAAAGAVRAAGRAAAAARAAASAAVAAAAVAAAHAAAAVDAAVAQAAANAARRAAGSAAAAGAAAPAVIAACAAAARGAAAAAVAAAGLPPPASPTPPPADGAVVPPPASRRRRRRCRRRRKSRRRRRQGSPLAAPRPRPRSPPSPPP